MSSKIDLRECIAVAITEAQYDYLEMTGKREFRAVEKSIPEKCLEVSAARKIWSFLKGRGFNVIQEYTFSSIGLNLKEKFGDTRSKKLSGITKRFDIAVLDKHGKVFSLIEIKRKGSLSDAYKNGDIQRLIEMKSYIEGRTAVSIQTYFAYASTMHFYDDDTYNYNLSIEIESAKLKFGSKFYHFYDKNRSYNLDEDNLKYCFGSICGQV